jgi:hypothetical protein
LFAAKLKERMSKNSFDDNILVLIINEKYKIISKISSDVKYVKTKQAELEIVAGLPKDDKTIIWSAVNNLFEISLCKTSECVDVVNEFMSKMANYDQKDLDKLLAALVKNQNTMEVPEVSEAYENSPEWASISDIMKSNREFINLKHNTLLLLQDIRQRLKFYLKGTQMT